MPTDAHVIELPYPVRDEVDLDAFAKGQVGHLDAAPEQGDAPVENMARPEALILAGSAKQPCSLSRLKGFTSEVH